MAFYLTSHLNIVNNNLFQYLIMFMFYEKNLNKCCNYKNINFYQFDHAHIYISYENVMTELKLSWQNFQSLHSSGLEQHQVQSAEFTQNL